MSANSQSLSEELVSAFELSKAKAREIVDHIVGSMSASLAKGVEVSIPGFGKFSVVQRAARAGFNPKTGEKIKIKARKAVRFAVAKSLRDGVAGTAKKPVAKAAPAKAQPKKAIKTSAKRTK